MFLYLLRCGTERPEPLITEKALRRGDLIQVETGEYRVVAFAATTVCLSVDIEPVETQPT